MGVTYYHKPKKTVLLLLKIGGTKEYDDISSKDLEYLIFVCSRLERMIQVDSNHWKTLFAYSKQP